MKKIKGTKLKLNVNLFYQKTEENYILFVYKSESKRAEQKTHFISWMEMETKQEEQKIWRKDGETAEGFLTEI